MLETVATPRVGEVLTLVRELDHCPEPLALYSRLCDQGQRPDTLLLETADMPDHGNAKSLLLAACAVRVACRGREVTATALSDNGKNVLPWLAEQLAGVATVELRG